MPKRTDINSILIIGAGPIVIGQACEFDYSGAQACKALRAEGYRVILVNSNPATIMTDPGMADAIYVEPITWQVVARIIEKERPDAMLPTMGGQTALNCALDLAREGVLAKYSVEMIGASREAIDKAEDREKFKNAMKRIGLACPRSALAHSMEEALQVQAGIGFPVVIRPSFTLGGTGGGIAYNREEFVAICERGFDASPTQELLIEESVLGWKEFEMEVVRDRNDNCIIVCSIENLDPMGVHTGDSITVAPAQTLTDKEYQIMRDAAIAVLREVGVDTGGSNVQFAINPDDGRMIVIEMNPRVSRSSALASKATGFPIAKIAAKLAVGYTLDELKNDITGGRTPASFEPTIDYVVTKVPRFAFEKRALADLSAGELREFKRMGFSDRRLAYLTRTTESDVRARRHALGIRPVYKRVDTCAAEFSTRTAYMYSTYEDECEAQPTNRKKVIVLGGGPNRIGQGIEFDYCCVHAALALRDDGYETIMVNCNPETVTTDYDTSDRLYFEPLTLEDVLEIVDKERPWGVIVQYGGQTPLKLARELAAAGVPIIGTSAESIDVAEDRERFQQLLTRLKLRQPPNRTARSPEEALKLAEEIGYPVVVRPSYVLGGRAMEIVHVREDLERYMQEAVKVSNDSPVLLDRYLADAIEIDVDCVCDGKNVLIGGIMEHVEQAGVHSGDSACCLPPHSLASHLERELRRQTALMAKALKVLGLMNVQYAIQRDTVFVLEVNPRASRTVPYVSKATGVPLAMIAARCMAGRSLKDQQASEEVTPPYFSVKEAVFPFAKFPGVDTILGPEMKSTGEVMGVGETFGEAYVKSQLAAGVRLPQGGRAFISVRDADKHAAVQVALDLIELGFSLLATRGTAAILKSHGIAVTQVNKVAEGRPHIVDMIKNGEVSFIVNTVEATRTATSDSRSIRTTALARRVTYYTTIAGAKAACAGMKHLAQLEPYRLQDLHAKLRRAAAEPAVTS